MDECPRCKSALEAYTLGEHTAIVCNRCGWADVPVDHESTPEHVESWQDALQRFYDAQMPR